MVDSAALYDPSMRRKRSEDEWQKAKMLLPQATEGGMKRLLSCLYGSRQICFYETLKEIAEERLENGLMEEGCWPIPGSMMS